MANSDYKFITVSPNGETKEWPSVREAFDRKQYNDRVYIVLVPTEERYRVLRP